MEIKQRTLLIGVSILLLVQITYGFAIYFALDGWQARGTFGDMFGGINALFSGLAFLGVLATLIIQRAEMQLQRQELELTRAEMARASSAQEHAAQAARVQGRSARETADLSTISFLIEYYRRHNLEISRHRDSINLTSEQISVREKIETLEAIIDGKYSALIERARAP